MVLLYFSYLIIVANILILSVGYVANIAFIGSFLGGLMAIGTDLIILILGALLGAGLSLVSSDQTATSYSPSSLSASTTYYWRVEPSPNRNWPAEYTEKITGMLRTIRLKRKFEDFLAK